MAETIELLEGCFLFLAIAAIYFIPVIVAGRRKHPNDAAIMVINIFLGWTLIGWVAVLAWAVNHSIEKK